MLKTAKKILNGECPVLVFFGDSVTHGEFEFTNGFKGSAHKPELAFHSLLKTRIKEEFGRDITVINAGIGGNFSDDGLARIQSDVLDKKPDFCNVMFGTNDVTNARMGAKALAQYERNMRQILVQLRENGIETVLMTPGVLCSHGVKGFTGGWWFVHKYYEGLQKKGKMDAYVECSRKVAKDLHIPIADAYAEWKRMEASGVDTTTLLINGMNHPAPEQHKIFANKLYDVLFNEEEIKAALEGLPKKIESQF
jgi:lysophospholipase L1-like esterase